MWFFGSLYNVSRFQGPKDFKEAIPPWFYAEESLSHEALEKLAWELANRAWARIEQFR